ncbi:MAG: hypothetical protein IRZ28_03530 [Steroidobacteraceae bacterium]|nr:hypothetical protein [Steroidobacteraceae bacterium]
MSGKADHQARPCEIEGCPRITLEDYFRVIDEHLKRNRLEQALRLSAALPKICSALEHPRLVTSATHCICWCDAWVASDADGANVNPLSRVYLHCEEEPMREWIELDDSFARSVSESLLRASRAWYLRRGAYDLTVQQNLGRLALTVD